MGGKKYFQYGTFFENKFSLFYNIGDQQNGRRNF